MKRAFPKSLCAAEGAVRARGIMLIDDAVQKERFIRRDLPSFEQLFKLHNRRVYALCLRMTGNTADAEDLAQEVFVQVFRKLDTFRGDSAFTTWLHRLTVNFVLMHFRKNRGRKEQLTEDGELPEHVIKSRNVLTSFPILDRLALDEAIVKLAPGYRAVFVLHDVEGLQHDEIANILGCSAGTSKSQLHKARMKLRHFIRQSKHSGKAPMTSSGVKLRTERVSPSRPKLQRRHCWECQ
ncbi:MAG TPA: RNA polymerase sigma factor [Pyrinomonadaceae bacterium]|nr:RNA polymerase sigma factor [Pyrinomonadaceae bacterium]